MKVSRIIVSVLALVPLACFAKGPIGIGKLEVGVSRDAVEALSQSDGVYLDSPLVPYDYKHSSPVPGEDKFNTRMVSPLSDQPQEAVLTFVEGQLNSIYVKLGDSSRIVDSVKSLIASKYGEPKVDNSMKEEQCIYKGGQNFKVSSGTIRYDWRQDRPNAEAVTTSISDVVMDMCPSNLRYAIGAIKLKSLTIGIAKPEKPAVNPF
jgi:hypothetical protein